MLPDPIKKFAAAFAQLPSIGLRQATRLAFHIASLSKAQIRELADAITALGTLTTCTRCFRTHLGSGDLCAICSDPTRNTGLIAIVEKETDIISLEKTRKFNGWYLLLGELHKSGELEHEQKLRIEHLKKFIAKELGGKATEIILAINPTVYGDLNAALLKKDLEPLAQTITRLGRGIPTGGEIEFADEDTLGEAIERRK
ncbi:toprim domain-containing protein [Patescibacteria group bacterium]|nr:toprim domain-containing protein [Patescibacteria group bacterium]